VFKQVANNTCPAPDCEWLLEDLSLLPHQHTTCGDSLRQRGTDNAIHAEAAVRSLLSGTATVVAKAGMLMRSSSGSQERQGFSGRCRTRAITQLKALLIVVPAELREALQHLDNAELVNRCIDRNEEVAASPLTAARLVMRTMAERIRHLEQKFMVLGRHSIGSHR